VTISKGAQIGGLWRKAKWLNRQEFVIVGWSLSDLLMELTPCERRRDFSKPCGARFTDLAVAGR